MGMFEEGLEGNQYIFEIKENDEPKNTIEDYWAQEGMDIDMKEYLTKEKKDRSKDYSIPD